MRKIIEYEAIVGEYESTVNTKVGRRLSEGWQPYGPPSISRSNHTVRIVQAVVKYEPEPTLADFGIEETDHFEETEFNL